MKFSSRNEISHARKKGTVANEDPFRAGGARKQPFRVENFQKYKRCVFFSSPSHPDPNPLPRNPCGDFEPLLSSSRLTHAGAATTPPSIAAHRRCPSLLLSLPLSSISCEYSARNRAKLWRTRLVLKLDPRPSLAQLP